VISRSLNVGSVNNILTVSPVVTDPNDHPFALDANDQEYEKGEMPFSGVACKEKQQSYPLDPLDPLVPELEHFNCLIEAPKFAGQHSCTGVTQTN
jgi:hypothetical protein